MVWKGPMRGARARWAGILTVLVLVPGMLVAWVPPVAAKQSDGVEAQFLPECTFMCWENWDGSSHTTYLSRTGLWRVTDVCATPPAPGDPPNAERALMFNQGSGSGCNYNTGSPVSGDAVLSVDLTNADTYGIRFFHRHNTDPNVVMSLHVSDDGGATWSQVKDFTGTGPQLSWKAESLELISFGIHGGVALIRWHFDSVDGLGNLGSGWMIDDVHIEGSINLPAPCALPCPVDFESSPVSEVSRGGLWRVTDACSVPAPPSGTRYLAFNRGSGSSCTYDMDSNPTGGQAILAVDLTGMTSAALDFAHMHESEPFDPNVDFVDQMFLQVSDNGDDPWTMINDYTDDADLASWTAQSWDLAPYVGDVVYLRWFFWTNDAIDNTFLGWLVDDIVVTASPPPPDLVVEDITWGPSSPVDGDSVNFTAKVRNQGGATAGASTTRFLLDGATNLGDVATPSVSAGGFVTVSSSGWTATQGSHSIEATADVLGAVAESNEGNNQRTETVSVAPAPAPDLLVEDIAWSPASPVEGDSVTFTATVRNQGAAPAGVSTTRFLLDGSTNLGDVATPAIPAGGSAMVSSSAWIAVAGSHSIEAESDVGAVVAESNEANNLLIEMFSVAALPDLAVVSIVLSPSSPTDGQTVIFTATVDNIGLGDAPGSLTRFVLDGSLILGDAATPAIPAGGSASVSVSWTATQGAHTVVATADHAGAVEETDEGNNPLQVAFSVAPRPDLVVDAITLSPASPKEGESVAFQATVRNQGSGPAGASSTRFVLDGGATVVGSAATPALDPGESALVSAPAWTATFGSHTVRATADAPNSVPESVESNNALEVPFDVDPLANLRVTALALSPPAPKQQDAVVFRATATNQGNLDAAASTTRFVVDGSILVGDVATPPLAAGGSVVVESPAWTATVGAHVVEAAADHAGGVEESREDDNARTQAFSVRPAGILVDVAMTQGSYSMFEAAEGRVNVTRELDGAPLAGANVTVVVTYASGVAALDAALAATGCREATLTGVSDDGGGFVLEVPPGLAARCAGGPGVADFPSSLLGGTYRVVASAEAGLGQAGDETEYAVTAP